MLTITLQQLTDLRACEPAARLFSEQFGDRLDIPEYTPQHQEWLVRSEWRRYLGWVWGNNVLPQWSMREADLSEADLRGAVALLALDGWSLIDGRLERAEAPR